MTIRKRLYISIVIVVFLWWFWIKNTSVLAQSTDTSDSTQTVNPNDRHSGSSDSIPDDKKTDSQETDSLSDMAFNFFGIVLNLLYLFTLPILIIAWKSVDNSMVYGEFMNFDPALYTIRNISRTLANFAIGWILLWRIFRFILQTPEEKNPKFVKDFLIKSVIIVLWINISWFGIGALIDLSTILTYSVGAIPLGAIGEFSDQNDMPLVAVSSFMDYESEYVTELKWRKAIDPYIYYKWWDINIPQCADLYLGMVIWPEYYPSPPTLPEVNFETEPLLCGLSPQSFVNITALEEWKSSNLPGDANNTEKNRMTREILRKLNNVSSGGCGEVVIKTKDWKDFPVPNYAWLVRTLQFWDSRTYTKLCDGLTIEDSALDSDEWKNILKSVAPYSSQPQRTLRSLIKDSEWMVWPFVTLYMTLLDYSNLSSIAHNRSSVNNTIWWFMEFWLKGIVSVAIFIPLIALAVILILRVVILRVIIAFIPLWIALAWLSSFTTSGGWWGFKKSILGMSLDFTGAWKWISTILWLIFAPVLPVFAISISIVLLQAFHIELTRSINDNNQWREFLWITSQVQEADPSIVCIDFWWIQEMCYKSDESVSVWSGFVNMIPRLFLNILGIGIMRMIVQVAFSANSVTKEVSTKVMNFGQKAITSAPLPGIGVSARTLWNLPTIANQVLSEKSDHRLSRDLARIRGDDQAITDKLNESASDSSAAWSNTNLQIQNTQEVKEAFTQSIAQNPGWASVQNFQRILNEQDPRAAQQFNTLWSSSMQSEALLSYINELQREDHNLSIDTEQLVKDLIEPRLTQILHETEQAKRDELINELKEYIDEQHIDKQKIREYFNTSQYKIIRDAIFSDSWSWNTSE